jgi:hypothetical protein
MRVVYRQLDENVTTIEHHRRQPCSIIPQLDVYEHNRELMLVTDRGGSAVKPNAAAQLISAEAAAQQVGENRVLDDSTMLSCAPITPFATSKTVAVQAVQEVLQEAASLLQVHFSIPGKYGMHPAQAA